MITKLNELLDKLERKAAEHRGIVSELHYSEGDRLDDRKYHDGMADAYNVSKIAVLEIFWKELKPDLIENIDDGIDLDREEG